MAASQAGTNATLTPGSFLTYAIDPTLQGPAAASPHRDETEDCPAITRLPDSLSRRWPPVARNGRVARSLPGGPEITTTIAAGNHAIGGMNTPYRWRIMGLQKRTGKTGSRQCLGYSSLTRTCPARRWLRRSDPWRRRAGWP